MMGDDVSGRTDSGAAVAHNGLTFNRRWIDGTETLPTNVRYNGHPIILIDPEADIPTPVLDAFRRAWDQADRSGLAGARVRAGLRAALRELAHPGIPEPTGHMAVVEDVNGNRWVNWRDPRATGEHDQPWVLTHDSSTYCDYADINVVRVLSEGVPA